MSKPYIFSMIFFCAFSIYLFIGMYILSYNSKSHMLRIFFHSCISLSLWTFAFSISNTAPNEEISLIWRRVAALGWGSFFSFLLHFTLFLTGKNKWLKKKWTYLFIYLPAFINIFVFSLYGNIAEHQYKMVYSHSGWINTSTPTIWDKLYQLYYIGFSLIILSLVWNWGKTSKDRMKMKQTILLGTSYIVAAFIGTLTDFVLNTLFAFKVPQIGSVIILLPIITMLYCIKKYGLITPLVKNQVADEGQILSEATRTKLFNYLTRGYMIGSFINFASQYFGYKKPLESTFLFSALLFLLGFSLQLVQGVKLKKNLKDFVSNLLLTATIPLLIVTYVDYSPVYAWVAPVLFAIASIAFNQRWMLRLNSVATLLTLVWIWVKYPVTYTYFGLTDHLVRIGIFAIVLWMAYYINNVYLQRLLDNEEQVKIQKLLTSISANFVTVNERNIDEKMNNALALCGDHFHVDRTYIFFLTNDQKSINRIYEWSAEGITTSGDIVDEISSAGFPNWLNLDKFFHRESIYIPEVSALPIEGVSRDWLQSKQIKSLIVYPLRNQERVQGFMSFETIRDTVAWKIEQQEILKVIANHISDTWFKVEAEKEINYRAFYDSLTGLPNRELFKVRLEQAINMAKLNDKLVGVAFVDIDSFKLINDTMGHEGGDTLLKQMGQRLSGNLRKFDTVSRFGGDEFLILLTQASQLEDIRKEADKIMEAIKQSIKIKNQEFFITASVGIAVYPKDGEDTEDLIKNADLAMYVSKQEGKNKYTICSTEMKENVVKDMELTNSLYRALERNELLLYYQPQVDCTTGEITGVEALLRWLHPEKGMIPPLEFIPVAEKTGLVNPIGEWVLETACRQNKEWQLQGFQPMKMAVNLSLAQFHNPNLVEMVHRILEETELDPNYLEVEITESIAGNEEDIVDRVLIDLKELGVSISIDDFGKEYSSLSRIKTLPVDQIKIDGEFIHGITKSSKDEGIIKVMIQLGKNLGLNVLAERVETEQQLAFLKDNRCDLIQGYYFYKPMPAEEIEKVLKLGNKEELTV